MQLLVENRTSWGFSKLNSVWKGKCHGHRRKWRRRVYVNNILLAIFSSSVSTRVAHAPMTVPRTPYRFPWFFTAARGTAASSQVTGVKNLKCFPSRRSISGPKIAAGFRALRPVLFAVQHGYNIHTWSGSQTYMSNFCHGAKPEQYPLIDYTHTYSHIYTYGEGRKLFKFLLYFLLSR